MRVERISHRELKDIDGLAELTQTVDVGISHRELKDIDCRSSLYAEEGNLTQRIESRTTSFAPTI